MCYCFRRSDSESRNSRIMAAFLAVVNNRSWKGPVDADAMESRPIVLPELSDTVFDYELGMLTLNG
jgi:hypothetical protein